MGNPHPVDPPSPGAGRNRIASWLHTSLQLPAVVGGDLKVLGFVALLNALIFALFFAIASPGYETNDDLGMQLIASGFYTGQASEHLIFTNVVIGWMLRCMYQLWDGCNWYLVYLVVVHFVSLTALAFLVVSRKRNWAFVLLYLGFFVLVETRILLSLQFTTTAFLAGTAGLLLLVDSFQPGHPTRWPRVIAGVGLITLMGMIREDVMPFLAILSFPFLIERSGFTGVRRLLGAGLVCFALFLFTHEFNRWYYARDPAWAEFQEYNKLRGQVHGTPLARFVSRAAPAAGWSENDAWMFTQFYFPEPDVYADISKMRRLVGTLENFAEAKPQLNSFSTKYLFLWKSLGGDSGILMNLALLNAVWCLFAAGSRWKRCFFTLTVMYGLFVLLAIYLPRLPQRITYNMPLIMHAVCLYWATGFQQPRPATSRGKVFRNLYSKLCRGCFLVWTILYGMFLWKLTWNLYDTNAYYRNLKQISLRIYEPFRSLLPAGRKPLLIPLPFNSVLEQCLFYCPSSDAIPFYLVPYGWTTHSPLFRQMVARHEINPYSLSLVERPDVFFLMEKQWLEPLQTFYREHYHLDIRFNIALNTDEMPQYRDCQIHLYQAHAVRGEPTKNAAP